MGYYPGFSSESAGGAIGEMLVFGFAGKYLGFYGMSRFNRDIRATKLRMEELGKVKVTPRVVLKGVGTAGLAVGGLAAVVLGATTRMAVHWDTFTRKIQANTNMSNKNLNLLRSASIKAAADSGGSWDDMAQSLKQATNMHYSMRDAITVMHAAMKSALPTGASVERVTVALGTAMKNFNIHAKDATRTMDILHTISAKARMDLPQFAETFAPVGAIAGSTQTDKQMRKIFTKRGAMIQAGSAMAALTVAGYTPSQAMNQVKNIYSHLLTPTGTQRNEVALLYNQSRGRVDLRRDFGYQALNQKGLAGILQHWTRLGLTPDQVSRLIPGLRGGIGAIALTGHQASSFSSVMAAAQAAPAKHWTQQYYNQYLQTPAAQMKIIQRQMQVMALQLGQTMIPVLREVLAALLPIVKNFTSWVRSHKELMKNILLGALALGGAVLAIKALTGTVRAMVNVYKGGRAVVRGLSAAHSFFFKQLEGGGSRMDKYIGKLRKLVGLQNKASGVEHLTPPGGLTPMQQRARLARKGIYSDAAGNLRHAESGRFLTTAEREAAMGGPGQGGGGFFRRLKAFHRDEGGAFRLMRGGASLEGEAGALGNEANAAAGLGRLAGMGSKISGAFKLMGSGAMSFMGTIGKLGMTLMTPPMGIILLIAGLAIGIYELYQHWKPFHEFVDKKVVPVLKMVGAALSGVFTWVTQNWKLLLPILLFPLAPVIIILEKFGPQIWSKIQGPLSAALGWVKDHWKLLATVFFAPFIPIYKLITDWGPHIFKKVSGPLSKILGWVKDHWKLIVGLLLAPLVVVTAIITAPFVLAYKFFTDWGPKLWKLFQGIWAGVLKDLGQFGTWALQQFKLAWNTLSNWVKNNWVGVLVGVLTTIFLGPASTLYALVWKLLPADFKKRAVDAMGGFVDGITGLLKSGAKFVKQIFDAGKSIGKHILSGIKDAVMGGIGSVLGGLGNFIGGHIPTFGIGGGGYQYATKPGGPFVPGQTMQNVGAGFLGGGLTGFSGTSANEPGNYAMFQGNKIPYHGKLADWDYGTGAGGTAVKLPGGSNAMYQYLGSYSLAGMGTAEFFATPNGGVFAINHLQKVNPALKAGMVVGGGALVGLSGQPTMGPYNGQAPGLPNTAGGDWHLCLVTDPNGQQYLMRVSDPDLKQVPTFKSKPGGGGYAPGVNKWAPQIMQASQKLRVSPYLIASLMTTESGGNQFAKSSAGAEGLLQLMPGTAASMGVKNIFDPLQNIMGGVGYLVQLYNGPAKHNLMTALEMYNAGPGGNYTAPGPVAYAKGIISRMTSTAGGGGYAPATATRYASGGGSYTAAPPPPAGGGGYGGSGGGGTSSSSSSTFHPISPTKGGSYSTGADGGNAGNNWQGDIHWDNATQSYVSGAGTQHWYWDSKSGTFKAEVSHYNPHTGKYVWTRPAKTKSLKPPWENIGTQAKPHWVPKVPEVDPSGTIHWVTDPRHKKVKQHWRRVGGKWYQETAIKDPGGGLHWVLPAGISTRVTDPTLTKDRSVVARLRAQWSHWNPSQHTADENAPYFDAMRKIAGYNYDIHVRQNYLRHVRDPQHYTAANMAYDDKTQYITYRRGLAYINQRAQGSLGSGYVGHVVQLHDVGKCDPIHQANQKNTKATATHTQATAANTKNLVAQGKKTNELLASIHSALTGQPHNAAVHAAPARNTGVANPSRPAN